MTFQWLLGDDQVIHRGSARQSMDLGWICWPLCGANALRPISGEREHSVLAKYFPACHECTAMEERGEQEPVRRPPPPRPVIESLPEIDTNF